MIGERQLAAVDMSKHTMRPALPHDDEASALQRANHPPGGQARHLRSHDDLDGRRTTFRRERPAMRRQLLEVELECAPVTT